ncbi:MAG: hypothetical protein FWC82_03440, partial [Firmicutes bacterium]|nr:hypothetical protein [Bacillota bacterium]
DDKFFKDKILAIVLIDQGSGNVKYHFQNVELVDNNLTVHVVKDAPMIQTMDFVSWVMFLELDKATYKNVTSIELALMQQVCR